MKLNCDLGESFGSWKMGLDEQVMPHIDQANVACGFHAGDAQVMAKTIALAKQHNVIVGAHPSYPDLQGFGRRSMKMSEQEIIQTMHYQIAALDGMALSQQIEISYVKPHGALYNDMMANDAVRASVMKAICGYHKPLQLMLQATADFQQHKAEAQQYGIWLIGEAFADRCYDDNGRLVARSKPGAVHTKEKMLEQVRLLKEQGVVITESGKALKIDADSLCVHGDNPEGVAAIEEIRELINP